ncbi:MAG: hypothetical protein JSV09_03430 [Thermoplasmata archaeon]|nr:MAG: hypothetical protein JSV09_03430 [Thermoplasmata archaeon]
MYIASYDLDPDVSFVSGNYDLYFMVADGTGETADDEYQNNDNELRITSATSPPQVIIDSTECDPSSVDRIGEYVTTISSQFSDSDSLSVEDFTVLFMIRDPNGNEIILVNNKSNGQSGEFGGSLLITSSSEGNYLASYTFDPDGSFQTGYFDLFCEVLDQHGNSDSDGYFLNSNELRITSSAAEPTVEAGATQVIPNIVDKTEDGYTTISARFEDVDSLTYWNFTVTFKVKDENGNEYIIVDSKGHEGPGEYGGTVSITPLGPNLYEASYLWNPPSIIANGNYSLYFKVEDEHGNFAEDEYNDNMNELLITGEVEEEPEDVVPGWFWIFLILILLIIFFIILFLSRRKKGEASYMPPQRTVEKTPPPYSYKNLTPVPPSTPPQQGDEILQPPSPPPPQDEGNIQPQSDPPQDNEGNINPPLASSSNSEQIKKEP